MTQTETLDRLKTLADGHSRISSEDKQFIREQIDATGAEIELHILCRNCYRDAAALCYAIIKKRMQDEEMKSRDESPRYILKDNVDVYFGDIRVNKHTLTDELAQSIIARGFPKRYFEKC